MAVKLTKRKGFNFFRSYYDVYNELETDADKVAFMDALLDRQFLGIKPTELKGMAKFAYISQTNSIDSQVKGYEDKTGLILTPCQPPTYGGNDTPCQQVQVEEEVKLQVKEKVEVKVKNTLLSEIKISDLENEEIIYFEIAKAYQQLFIKNLTEKNAPTANQEKAKYKTYVDPIRLMMVNDGVTKEQLTKVFKFLDSPGGEFWKPNILSTKKLREKFEQLIVKSQSINHNGKQQNNNNTGGASEAFRRKTAERLGLIQPD